MPANHENTPSNMLGQAKDNQLNSSALPKSLSATNNRAIVVGIYGVPGSGKTFLLEQLKQELGQEYFKFYDGSKMIASVVPGGLDAFQSLKEQEKVRWREHAIGAIANECTSSGQIAIVAGHFMFWAEEDESGMPIYTQNDLDTFTHILYLDFPVEVVWQRRLGDTERHRPLTSITHLWKWQEAEKTQLRDLCRNHGILFSLVSSQPVLLNRISTMLRDFQHHTEEYNLSVAGTILDEAVDAGQGQLETVLVLDADRTMAAADTGTMFWERISSSFQAKDNPLKALFSSTLGYSYTAFRQATLLYEEAADDKEYDTICQEVASMVTMYPEFVSLLRSVAKEKHVGAVIVSCGLRRVWEKVLERESLSEAVKVIGGGRIADGFVVTAAVKAALVARLKHVYKMYIWVFGDSPLDLGMMSQADQAIVVVGEERARSKTMDMALMSAIDNDGLLARQVILPSNASPRLDTTKLPLIQITDQTFIDSVLCHRSQHTNIRVLHATDRKAAKLLMTPMRDANVGGPALRKAHRRVGRYLATEFLADVIGIEEYLIPHVQGHQTTGYRLSNEQQTLIVALMRGGEPMAFGVNEAFPLAMFVHASGPDDLMAHHLQGRHTVVLVDSVINSGKTVVQFIKHIRTLYATIRIVVVAGVVQAESLSRGSFSEELAKISIVALRLSDNKFTGRGTTDTGNRLFNSTHLP